MEKLEKISTESGGIALRCKGWCHDYQEKVALRCKGWCHDYNLLKDSTEDLPSEEYFI